MHGRAEPTTVVTVNRISMTSEERKHGRKVPAVQCANPANFKTCLALGRSPAGRIDYIE
jgi:hypothetical protein